METQDKKLQELLIEESVIYKGLVEKCNKLQHLQTITEPITTKLNKIHVRIADREESKEGISIKAATKLQGIYSDSIEKTRMIEETLAQLDTLMAIKSAIEQIQRKKKRSAEPKMNPAKKPKLEESVNETHFYRPGDQVAVKLSTNTFWIMAVVMKWIPEKQKYEVMDAEDDEENPGTRKRYLSSTKMIVPIPSKSQTLFKTGDTVLALFPGSSCFYKAIVLSTPDQPHHHGSYTVKFEDDGDVERVAAPMHVLEYPQ